MFTYASLSGEKLGKESRFATTLTWSYSALLVLVATNVFVSDVSFPWLFCAARWNDDVVFKGQARTEPETKKRFVNDTIRNDFHRRFLTKYIK